MPDNDQRLIERGFPCHQVGAETQRERGASSALPPLYYLHVWWARRPLTPSRAAIVASLSSADTDPETFVRQLGIEKIQALVNGEPWTLTKDLLKSVEQDGDGREFLPVDDKVLRRLQAEEDRRAENRELIARMKERDSSVQGDEVLVRWEKESQPVPTPWPVFGEKLVVRRVMGDPAWSKKLMNFTKSHGIHFPGDPYGYARAFGKGDKELSRTSLTVLDPTAGGGSIPFEALRLGHRVIANELNPVAAGILHATLDYPMTFGVSLTSDIQEWGRRLLVSSEETLLRFNPDGGPLPHEEKAALKETLSLSPEISDHFGTERVLDFLFTRQVTCPHCRGDAPLLNTCWLSKEAKDPWGVKIVTDGCTRGGQVKFRTYRVIQGLGPDGEDPNLSTVNRGVGQCVHCKHAIPGDEIKAQARGESLLGQWKDRLYCVVAVRMEPRLDRDGKPQRYKSGPKKGEIKTRKVRFFRPPNDRDLEALKEAEIRLKEKWPQWEAAGLIPTERFPEGNDMRPVHYGMPRWCDLFTPRQLLGHVTLVEGLNRIKPQILAELGPDKGKAGDYLSPVRH